MKDTAGGEISRKSFFKLAGLVGAGTVLPQAIKAAVFAPQEKPLPKLHSDGQKLAICKYCPAFCLLQIRVVDGKPVGVAGAPKHPVSRGTLCPKGAVILQDLYHPDRLRSPVIQKGPRGSNRWEPVSWDKALKTILERLAALQAKKRPEALAVIASPVSDIRHKIQKRFAHFFGTPNFMEWSWPASQLPLEAFELMHGSKERLFYDFMRTDLIVSFGWDWLQAFPSHVEAQRTWGEIRQGRGNRTGRMIQIEPRLSITAAKADRWISIKGDTEGILALGTAYALINENLCNRDFINRWVSGFDQFKNRVLENYTPRKVAAATGVEAPIISELARDMASAKSCVAISRRSSPFTQAAVHSLNLLLGAIGVPGGLLATGASDYQFKFPDSSRHKDEPSPSASLERFPETILSGSRSPIEILWMEGVNPVFLSSKQNLWEKALNHIPFIMSFSSFLDESSRWADIIIPPHQSLEAAQDGFSVTADGKAVLSFTPEVIKPLYESGDLGDSILKLARSLGGQMASAFPWRNLTECFQSLLANNRLLKETGWLEHTAVKKGVQETLGSEFTKLRLPADVLNLKTTPLSMNSSRYPLNLYIYSPLAFSFGQGAHLPYLQSIAGAQINDKWESWLEINPKTAGYMGIKDGSSIWVESEAGRINVKARHYSGIRADTVSLAFGLGHTAMGRYAKDIGANPNVLFANSPKGTAQFTWPSIGVKIYGA
ncbi:MAG: molybdopterin-containing oxidoreductase family protein [Elusimicrobiota bacterium]